MKKVYVAMACVALWGCVTESAEDYRAPDGVSGMALSEAMSGCNDKVRGDHEGRDVAWLIGLGGLGAFINYASNSDGDTKEIDRCMSDRGYERVSPGFTNAEVSDVVR